MADIAVAWGKVLPEVKNRVTGVGVWTALNHARPLALEEGVFAIGMPPESGDLAGHLRLPQTKRLIEQCVSEEVGRPVVLKIVVGTSIEDWEAAKRKDAEAVRLQDQALQKMRRELESKSSWDAVYEQLARRYAAITTKSLPQNRARFFEEAVELIVEMRRSQETWDEIGERNFARCLERLAQYAEIPSALAARAVLKRAGEL